MNGDINELYDKAMKLRSWVSQQQLLTGNVCLMQIIHIREHLLDLFLYGYLAPISWFYGNAFLILWVSRDIWALARLLISQENKSLQISHGTIDVASHDWLFLERGDLWIQITSWLLAIMVSFPICTWGT